MQKWNEKDPSNHTLKNTARALRRGMTAEEKHIWYDFLKKLPFTVNRQKQLGGYIVDFLIAEARIVIEIDGSQHYSERGRSNDLIRDSRLNELGFTVLRITNADVKQNFEGVCVEIMKLLRAKGFNICWDELK